MPPPPPQVYLRFTVAEPLRRAVRIRAAQTGVSIGSFLENAVYDACASANGTPDSDIARLLTLARPNNQDLSNA